MVEFLVFSFSGGRRAQAGGIRSWDACVFQGTVRLQASGFRDGIIVGPSGLLKRLHVVTTTAYPVISRTGWHLLQEELPLSQAAWDMSWWRGSIRTRSSRRQGRGSHSNVTRRGASETCLAFRIFRTVFVMTSSVSACTATELQVPRLCFPRDVSVIHFLSTSTKCAKFRRTIFSTVIKFSFWECVCYMRALAWNSVRMLVLRSLNVVRAKTRAILTNCAACQLQCAKKLQGGKKYARSGSIHVQSENESVSFVLLVC